MRFGRLISALCLAGALVMGSALSGTVSAEDSTDVKALKDQMLRMQAEIDALKQQVKDLTGGSGGPNPMVKKSGKDNTLEIYGFVGINALWQDNNSTGAAGIDGIMWANRNDPTAEADNDSAFSIHSRNTRLGVKVNNLLKHDILGGPMFDGLVEWDFWGGNPDYSPSRHDIRLRHAFLRGTWEFEDFKFAIMAGQYWDLISPIFPTNDYNLITWNSGNLGDRRPQIRGTLNGSVNNVDWELAGALLRTEAVGNQNVDGVGLNDGDESGQPMLQGRFGLKIPSWLEGEKISFGIWGHSAKEDSVTPFGTDMEESFRSSSVGIDAEIPLLKKILNDDDKLALRGEWFKGKNLNDLRGGIGQGINGTTGEEISAQGGWAELNYKVNKFWSIAGGYAIDNPSGEDLPFNFASRRKNTTLYVSNWFDLTKSVKVGVVYEKHDTDYFGLYDGEVDRYGIFFQYHF